MDEVVKKAREEAAVKLQKLVHQAVASGNPVVSRDAAMEVVDAMTFATIEGIKAYLMEPAEREVGNGD